MVSRQTELTVLAVHSVSREFKKTGRRYLFPNGGLFIIYNVTFRKTAPS